ncbi:unnamed protein product [Microthlaspi erraticum]|uniref:LysM domain-containing protein n=1 Tax=Microthlaspi erraticum TaxID=1685480 RepID=A0A6D2L748_9BRAS|nr:unnamed protein product [Microthlaspi erraticum]
MMFNHFTFVPECESLFSLGNPPDPPDPPDVGGSMPLTITTQFSPPLYPHLVHLRCPSDLLWLPLSPIRSRLPISLFPNLTLVIDVLKSILQDLWQFGVNFLDMFNPYEILDDLSFMEFISLPKLLLGLSGVIAGCWSSKLSNTSCLVGSVAWCFVTIEFIDVIRIVKLALDAFSISGLGLLDVSYNAHGTISLIHTIVVEFFGFGGSSVLLSLINVVVLAVVSIPALFSAPRRINTATADQSSTTIPPSNSHFMALSSRDTLRLIFQSLTVADLARASCVSRIWNSVATEDDLVVTAFTARWRIKELVGRPVSGSFWRDNGIWKFAISHRISRGDSVTSLAVKYSVQVMDIKRLNNMMSDHGIYSRDRLLIPISNPVILANTVCYIEVDKYAKREVAVLYLEGGPKREQEPNHTMSNSSELGKRRLVDSLRRSMQVDDGTAQYYLAIAEGDPRSALSEFSADLTWERQAGLN